jgi:hypothetical protein
MTTEEQPVTAQQNPPPTWGTPPPPPQPDAPKSRPFKAGFLGCFGVLAAAVVVIVVIAMLAADGTTTDPDSKTITPARTSKPAATKAAPAAQPKPADFELTVKTLSKKCFDTAGCNVTYRIEVAYGGPALDPATTYEVTYEVRGPEDGPQINTMTVTGDQSSVQQQEYASTKSSATKLKAVVTDVAEQ